MASLPPHNRRKRTALQQHAQLFYILFLMSTACKCCYVRKGADTNQWANERQRIGSWGQKWRPALLIVFTNASIPSGCLNCLQSKGQQPKDSSIADMKKGCNPLPGVGSCPWPCPGLCSHFSTDPGVSVSCNKHLPANTQAGMKRHPELSCLPFCTVPAHAAVRPGQPWHTQSRAAVSRGWQWDEMRWGRESRELSRLQAAQELILCLAHWFSSHPVASVQFVLDQPNSMNIKKTNSMKKQLWNLLTYTNFSRATAQFNTCCPLSSKETRSCNYVEHFAKWNVCIKVIGVLI